MSNVYLKSGKEESLKRYHPWVFSGAISRIEGNVLQCFKHKSPFTV